MAGGRVRLFPLTEIFQADAPRRRAALLEIIIKQLRDVGVKRVNITTHHCAEKIEQHSVMVRMGSGSAVRGGRSPIGHGRQSWINGGAAGNHPRHQRRHFDAG